ncbi:MAG TPA: HAD-IA family hydrolase [Magnetospirillaceae bacterium]|nr:HAD-IA family hydrolase [Magnetospirillaceae bacterium]
MRIRLVSFDVWSTLVKSNQSYKRMRAHLLASALGVADVTEVTTKMNLADDMLDDETVMTGAQFGFEARVERTAKLLRVPAPTAEGIASLRREMDQAFLDDLPTLTEPDLLETLEILHGLSLILAVNSNTGFVSGMLMREMLDKLGILAWVQITLFSDEIGAAKPNPKVFERLITESGLDATQILHVGDNIDTDYRGAEAAGLHALHYVPNKYASEFELSQLSLLALLPLLNE